MMKKTNHILFHCAVLLYFAAMIAIFFIEKPMTETPTEIEQAIGIVLLLGGTIVAGGTFFLYDPEEDFERYMLLPLAVGAIMAYFASRVLADDLWFRVGGMMAESVGLVGIALCLIIPQKKLASLHFVTKVLAVLAFGITYLFQSGFVAIAACVLSLAAVLLYYMAEERY